MFYNQIIWGHIFIPQFSIKMNRQNKQNSFMMQEISIQWTTCKWNMSAMWDTSQKQPLQLLEINVIGSVGTFESE